MTQRERTRDPDISTPGFDADDGESTANRTEAERLGALANDLLERLQSEDSREYLRRSRQLGGE